MIQWTTIVSTILGGSIAGFIGIFSTLVARYLDRRERHLNEHKENFKIIDRALVELKNKVWPFHYGAENLKLGHTEPLSDESVRCGILGTMLISSDEDGSQARSFIVDKVDRELYYDIPRHFKDLGKKLREFDESIKKDGINLSILLSKVTEAIYSKMYESDFQVLKWPFDKGVKAYFRDLKGTLEEQEYSGIIFLILIGEDERSWPNMKNTYERVDLYNGLKKISECLRDEIADDLKNLLSLFKKLDNLENECHKILEKEKHDLKLKGRSKYSKF